MAKKLKVGDTIRGYRVTKVFGPGMMAISYGAEAPDGREGLPQAVQVAVADGGLVSSVRRLPAGARRAESATARRRTTRSGWSTRSRRRGAAARYFPAYEFVENGRDLEHMLDEEREIHRRTKVAPTRDPAVWARHVTWAKVFMAGIAALHESKIVHADLKPANAFLIKDPSIGAGLSAQADRHGFLAARRPPGAMARLSGLRRHRQLPIARAHDARRGAGARVGHLHVRA